MIPEILQYSFWHFGNFQKCDHSGLGPETNLNLNRLVLVFCWLLFWNICLTNRFQSSGALFCFILVESFSVLLREGLKPNILMLSVFVWTLNTTWLLCGEITNNFPGPLCKGEEGVVGKDGARYSFQCLLTTRPPDEAWGSLRGGGYGGGKWVDMEGL